MLWNSNSCLCFMCTLKFYLSFTFLYWIVYILKSWSHIRSYHSVLLYHNTFLFEMNNLEYFFYWTKHILVVLRAKLGTESTINFTVTQVQLGPLVIADYLNSIEKRYMISGINRTIKNQDKTLRKTTSTMAKRQYLQEN